MSSSPHPTPSILNFPNPRKRPSLSTAPSNLPSKRRKPSSTNQPIVRHPSHLRQTSFPPDEDGSTLALSPPLTSGGLRSREMSVDSVATGLLAPGSIKSGKGASGKLSRKKLLTGEKMASRAGSVKGSKDKSIAKESSGADTDSVAKISSGGTTTTIAANGKSTGSQSGAPLEEQEGEEEGEPEPEPEDEGNMAYEGEELTEAEEKRNRSILLARMEMEHAKDHAARFAAWIHAAPRKDLVKKLVNHTLSQSVTAPVLTTVQGAIRVFASELVDMACQVRKEQQVAADTLPNGQEVPDDMPLEQRKAEVNRGPLTPDHLREALRRYKRARDGALPGQMGLSLAGLEFASPRTGGKRLFR